MVGGEIVTPSPDDLAVVLFENSHITCRFPASIWTPSYLFPVDTTPGIINATHLTIVGEGSFLASPAAVTRSPRGSDRGMWLIKTVAETKWASQTKKMSIKRYQEQLELISWHPTTKTSLVL